MNATSRALGSAALLAVAFWFVEAKGQPQDPQADGPEPLYVVTTPVPLNNRDESLDSLGRLKYLGGLHLFSSHPDFGGLSGLVVGDHGRDLLAVTDRGHFVTASPQMSDGRFTDLTDFYISPILDWKGETLPPGDSDSEALTLSPDGTSAYVGFEGFSRIWRYPAPLNESFRSVFSSVARPVEVSGEILNQPRNGGLESVVSLRDGRLLAISEDARRSAGVNRAWLIDLDGQTMPLGIKVSDDFKPVDAARLPDGDILVLFRRYSLLDGVAIRLGRVAQNTIAPDAVLDWSLLAELRPPYTVDNMEGVAVCEGADGEVIIWLVSDDNFRSIQRTLLLAFALDTSATGDKSAGQ